MSEIIKLEKDTYDSVKLMLESPDEEDAIVGITCINNSDFKTNMAYILLMIHEANISSRLWEKHASETSKTYEKILKTSVKTNTTYTHILLILQEYEVQNEDYQFFMDRYSSHLTKILNKHIKKSQLDSIDIKLNFNES